MAETNEYDYVIVGGGTAGSVIASRLTENPDVTVAVIEGGPSDIDRDDVLTLRRWLGLLGGELDYGYTTTEQPRGNSHILHSRAKVLGGCSSHNTLISFKPLPSDWDEWEEAGATGWNAEAMDPYYGKLRNNVVRVAKKDQNQIATDWVEATKTALGVPEVVGFNDKTEVHGFMHTEALHVVERFRRLEDGSLQYDVTVDFTGVTALADAPMSTAAGRSTRAEPQAVDAGEVAFLRVEAHEIQVVAEVDRTLAAWST